MDDSTVTSRSGQENTSNVHTSVHIEHELHYFFKNTGKIWSKELRTPLHFKGRKAHNCTEVLSPTLLSHHPVLPISFIYHLSPASPLLPHVHRPRLPALDQYPLQSHTLSLRTLLMQIWASSVSWRAVSPSPLVTYTGTHARVRFGSTSCDSPKLTLFCH